jgi:hypothetical protein
MGWRLDVIFPVCTFALKFTVFLAVTRCCLVECYQRFGGTAVPIFGVGSETFFRNATRLLGVTSQMAGVYAARLNRKKT